MQIAADSKEAIDAVLKDRSVEEMKGIRAYVDQQITLCREETSSTKERIQSKIAQLQKKYDSIDWGCGDWTSEKTSDAVDKLESHDKRLKHIKASILEMLQDESADSVWKVALTFSNLVARQIFTAEEHAFKLVNGSCGEWCPNTAHTIVKLWAVIFQSGQTPANRNLIKSTVADLKDMLGDYGDIDIPESIQEACERRSKKPRLSLEHPEIIIID